MSETTVEYFEYLEEVMSTIAALSSPAGAQAPSKSFDSQIKALEKRVDAGVKNGTITSDQAAQINKALNAVQQTIDQSSGQDNLSVADRGDISKTLRDIASTVEGGSKKTESGGPDSDGDNDGCTGYCATA